jgi:hypothetical protein
LKEKKMGRTPDELARKYMMEQVQLYDYKIEPWPGWLMSKPVLWILNKLRIRINHKRTSTTFPFKRIYLADWAWRKIGHTGEEMPRKDWRLNLEHGNTKAVVLHELEHARQMSEYEGTRVGWGIRYLLSKKFRLKVEVEAEAVETAWRALLEEGPWPLHKHVSHGLAGPVYKLNLTPEELSKVDTRILLRAREVWTALTQKLNP